MAEVLCPNCGKSNSEHREFCDFCDIPLDGALRVDGGLDAQRGDLPGDQIPESQDDSSRLDSLIPAPDEDIQPPSLDDFRDEEPLNGDSRLDSFFADDPPAPSREDPDPPGDLNGGSRLDDYLPVDEPEQRIEPENAGDDDSSRLDEHLTPSEPPQEIRLTTEHLYQETEDGSSRLDDYLSPEDSSDELNPDEVSRLNDFFADDPFKSPDPYLETSAEEEKEEAYSLDKDPFGEPPPFTSELTSDEPGPAEDPLLSRDDLWSDPASDQPVDESDFLTKFSDEVLSEDVQPAEPEESGEQDFLAPARESIQPPKDTPSESEAEIDWDFLEPATPASQETEESPPESPEEEKPAESIDPGEWDFLDPVPETKQPESMEPQQPEEPGEMDLFDPTPEAQVSESVELPEPEKAGELKFVEPAPEPESEGPPDSGEVGEWDFLDPGPSTEELDAGILKGSETEVPEDWSFLDPGPSEDLLAEESDQEPAPEQEGTDAGWLDMLQDPGSRSAPPQETEPTTDAQKPQTDWLDKIRRLNQSSDLVDEDSSFPDWLTATGKTAEFGEEDPESSDDVPDWLKLDDDESLNEFLRRKDLTNEEYKPKITTDSLDDGELTSAEDGSDPDLSDSQQIKFPSWAEEEKQKEQQHKKAQAEGATAEGTDAPIEPLQVEDEVYDDLFSEELPSWLTADAEEDVRQTLGQNLAQGELPGWVEAIRPVVESADASGLDEDEEYIENYGPLAGIPGVLPAEAEIGIDFDKAVQKPLDLLATKKQKEYVDRLKKLIGDENKSKTIILPSPPQTQRILRWLIAVLMLVAIAGTLIFTTSIDAAPLTTNQLQGSGFNALYEEIEILYDGQPVLIAFDYQPAAAGELHTAAASVVDHLMEQGTFLTFISTQPTGPGLAEQFLDTTQSHHNYIHSREYINLGYIPGESAGLVSFLIAPERIIPLAYDGSQPWESPPLISIDNIADFQMILVITDDPNTAKIWIEQVGPRLNKTPLTMIVSAQVEPLIQPYFRTTPRQIHGYVAGIIDSMNYEVLTDRPFLAHKYWLPFNLGIVISVGIIFIGGLANGVLSLFSRHKKKDEGVSE